MRPSPRGLDALREINEWLEKRIPPNERRIYNECPVCGTTWHTTGLFSAETHQRDCWVPSVNLWVRGESVPSSDEQIAPSNSGTAVDFGVRGPPQEKPSQ